MIKVFLNGKYEIYSSKNPFVCFFYLNMILSERYNETKLKYTMSVNIPNSFLVIKIEKDTYTVENFITISKNILDYIPYLFLHNDYLINYINSYSTKILVSDNLLFVFYNSSLVDPYSSLLDQFKFNEDSIFQTFILFLNKTVSETEQIVDFKPEEILGDFFNNCNKVPHEYNKLLLNYLNLRKILPFQLSFKKLKF